MSRPSRWLFHRFFVLVQVAPLFMQWPLTQLLPAAWEGNMSHCYVCISYMSMVVQSE